MEPNPKEILDFVTFTKETLNEKLHVFVQYQIFRILSTFDLFRNKPYLEMQK